MTSTVQADHHACPILEEEQLLLPEQVEAEQHQAGVTISAKMPILPPPQTQEVEPEPGNQ